MLESIKSAINSLADDIKNDKQCDPEDNLFRANSIKVLTEAAGNAAGIEAYGAGAPFFTEQEAISIAEEMATVGACPCGLTCEGESERDTPCNVCWLDYLSEARK